MGRGQFEIPPPCVSVLLFVCWIKVTDSDLVGILHEFCMFIAFVRDSSPRTLIRELSV